MRNLINSLFCSALLALTLILGTAALAAAAPVATISGTCSLSSSEQRGGLGATYVTYLSVKSTSCASAKKVVKKFHKCRRSAGGVRGKCNSRVSGYKCTERRNAIKTQFSSTTTCKTGAKKIVFKYTQFT